MATSATIPHLDQFIKSADLPHDLAGLLQIATEGDLRRVQRRVAQDALAAVGAVDPLDLVGAAVPQLMGAPAMGLLPGCQFLALGVSQVPLGSPCKGRVGKCPVACPLDHLAVGPYGVVVAN